jgi:hypothetical protein
MIPKKIHIYWNDLNNIPPLIKKCIENIKKVNYDFNVKIYSKKDIPFKLPLNIIPQYESDIFRLYILYKEGGIYIDASCLFKRNLKYFIDLSDNRLQLYTQFKGSSIENWFLVSPSKTKLIYEWLKQELLITKIGREKYIQYYKSFSNNYLNKQLPYLVNFLAFHVSYYKLTNIKNNFESSKLIKNLGLASDINNPLEYLKRFQWNSKKAIYELLNNVNINNIDNFIKLRNEDRKNVVEFIQKNNFQTNSFLYKLLKI